MTTVYLIRHAEAEGNLYRRCHGHYDSTITDRGYRQIAALSKRFANGPIDAVYSSDLTRTQTTAMAVTRANGLPLHTTPELREVGVGVWEDKTWTWLATHDRERLIAFNTDIGSWHIEGGQDMADVRARMTKALNNIIAAHPDQTVAVFSHGMALRTLIGTLQGMSLAEIDRTGHAENTAVTKLEADESGIRVVYRDDASHLPEELTTVRKQAWTKSAGGIEPGIYFQPDKENENGFDVMREDGACVGRVGVGGFADGVAEIEEFRLDERARGKNFGIRLVGQAVSCARSRGCTAIRIAIPRSDARAVQCAIRYGFSTARATPETVVYQLYFGYDEEYRLAKLEEALKEIGC